MDKANVIISIIIVLCIAAAVTAYGLTNTENPIFSGLSSMNANPDDGNGIGNATSNGLNTSSVATTTGGSSSSSSGSSGSSSSSGSGSGSSSSGSSSGSSSTGSSSSSGSDSGSQVSSSAIKSDAWNHIGEEGCYPGTPYYSGSYWYVTIYDDNGTAVDSFQYSSSGEFLGRG